MDSKDVIDKVVHLPDNFYKLNNISMYSLLEKTGYFQIHYKISENDIMEELYKHPDLVQDWLNWSENKRVDFGWYFVRVDNQRYVVDHTLLGGRHESTSYSDILEACAVYIKREIEDIRRS